MNDYQKYIAISRYARYIEAENRRETWEESVNRYMCFFKERYSTIFDLKIATEIEKAIVNLDIMPSMRALWTAGKALHRDNVAGYNCGYTIVDSQRAFDEAMYVLMCGTGLGFSVERQYISNLPTIAESFHETDTTISVADSKIGWASALRELISLLYVGKIPKWDMSKIRPAGAALKIFGGRASGHEPLEFLFKNIIRIFSNAVGRKLHSTECHDIMCFIADTVNVGGVRRSACISLSNLSDDRMRMAKTGNWQDIQYQRRLANNSVVYTEKPDFISFLKEWESLYESKSGERGFINRVAFQKKCESIGRDSDHEFGVNPCGEIILRPYQFCNLTEIVVRHYDDCKSLAKKVELATILGTMQSTLTDFRYLRKAWKHNCEEERLLGVSLTGIMDNEFMGRFDVPLKSSSKTIINYLRGVAKWTNREWSKKLGINSSKAITCVKPSGTVSQLVNSSSGIHPRFAEYYTRYVTNEKQDPIGKFMAKQGVPYEEDERNYYFKFPEKAPKGSRLVKNISALEQLNIWKTYASQWCDHNPSQTIYYNDNEFLKIGQWVWDNFDKIGGLSFFPKDDHIYQRPVYKEINEKEYKEAKKQFKEIKWEDFKETVDNTTGAKEVACTGGNCEI